MLPESDGIQVEILEKAIPVLFGKSRYKVLHGGRGSAKSWSVARYLLARAYTEGIRWLCAREFQSSMKESVHFLLDSQIQMMGLGSEFEVQRDQIIGPNNSLFAFAGLHDKGLDSLKSYEGFDGCWIEEGQSISRRSLQILKPTIRKAGSEIIITLNPENEDDPVYQDFILKPPPNASVIEVNWHDNPWFNDVLDEERRQDYERDPELAAWIWGGQCRTISDKQVLRGKIEVRPFAPTELWDGPYQGIDFGFGTDPVCLIRCWIWEGCLYIQREAYGVHCEIEDHPALFDSIEGAREFVTRADNSRPEMISYLRRNGYSRVVACQKWAGCVEDRVSYLRSFHRIIIDPSCKNIIQEGKSWSWKTNKAGDILNVLMPGHDHGWDAVGYAVEPHILGYKKKHADDVEQEEFPGMSQLGIGGHGWLR